MLLSGPGCYSLVIALANRQKIRIGQLGKAHFPSGNYVYTGSAIGGLKSRLRRHFTYRKKRRWHVDYLLSARSARIKAVLTYAPAPGEECRRNQFVARLPGAQIIMRKFGASDCRAGCRAHLYFFSGKQAPTKILDGLKLHSKGHLQIRKNKKCRLKNPL